MCCKKFVSKIATLAIAFGLGMAAVAYFTASPAPMRTGSQRSGSFGGVGASGVDYGTSNLAPETASRAIVPVKFISKPKAVYTDVARNNNLQGVVTLKITLLASGEVGEVKVVSGLPDGLTEQAIAAAKLIRFEPKKVNGQPVTATMTFQYGFNTY